MKLEINLDIESILKSSVESAVSVENVSNLIDDHVKKSVEESLKSALNQWSPFHKEMEKQIAAAMPIGDYQIPRYHDYILGAIRDAVADVQLNNAKTFIYDQVKDLVSMDVPESIQLQEVVNKFVNDFRRYSEQRDHTLIIEVSDSGKSIEIYADKTERRSKYQCSIHARLHKDEDGEAYRIWSLKCEPVSHSRYISCSFGSDQMMLNLYTARTAIIIENPHEIDTSDLLEVACEVWREENGNEWDD